MKRKLVRARCDEDLPRAGCDRNLYWQLLYGEPGAMESYWVLGVMECWVWWRTGCDGEILSAGCDGELGVMENYRVGSLGVTKSLMWRRTRKLSTGCEHFSWSGEELVWWRVFFLSPPLWCRFIILDYQRDTALPRRLQTSTSLLSNKFRILKVKNTYLMLLIYFFCQYISSKDVDGIINNLYSHFGKRSPWIVWIIQLLSFYSKP